MSYLTEPTTLITDYLLGGMTLWLGCRLLARSFPHLSRKLWGGALLVVSVAAFTGGSSHGFVLLLPPSFITALWKTTLVLTGLSNFLMLSAALVSHLSGGMRRLGLLLTLVKLCLYWFWIVTHDQFLYVIYDYGFTMLLVLMLQSAAWWRRRLSSSPWVVTGILLSFAAGALQQSRFSLHRHLNHNDLFHLMQMVAFYLLYRGGTLLRDFR